MLRIIWSRISTTRASISSATSKSSAAASRTFLIFSLLPLCFFFFFCCCQGTQKSVFFFSLRSSMHHFIDNWIRWNVSIRFFVRISSSFFCQVHPNWTKRVEENGNSDAVVNRKQTGSRTKWLPGCTNRRYFWILIS